MCPLYSACKSLLNGPKATSRAGFTAPKIHGCGELFFKELSEIEQPNSLSLLEACEFQEPECKRDLLH